MFRARQHFFVVKVLRSAVMLSQVRPQWPQVIRRGILRSRSSSAAHITAPGARSNPLIADVTSSGRVKSPGETTGTVVGFLSLSKK
jgi:hypothetical protein